MIGGMIGNNSSGANSIVYGDTRSNVLELSGFLSDGTKATFGPVTPEQFLALQNDASLIGSIYRRIHELFSDAQNCDEISHRFPKASIGRRNTGYALDSLLSTQPFDSKGGDKTLNLCSLLTGSEGTLFFITEAKLSCVPKPEPESVLVCAHFDSIEDALRANVVAMSYRPDRCELMDKYIISGIQKNRINESRIGFIEGNPAAILMIEFKGNSKKATAEQFLVDPELRRLSSFLPVLAQEDADSAWAARRASLGGLQNIEGKKSAITIIEDAAVDITDLPNFVADVQTMLQENFQTDCVVYGHAGAGELHLRPWLDRNDPGFAATIRSVATEFVTIVKRYQGALSGEHGSGRSRSEFIEKMVGERCYDWMKQIKTSFDPNNIFNPGKIIHPVPMDAKLRLEKVQALEKTAGPSETQSSYFQFSQGGLMQTAARCSGSGDCRKSHLAGGTMCPSYHATKNEKDSTRARANLLRQHMTGFDQGSVSEAAVHDILDMCLSCKACKSECPSNVDMAKIKSEFLANYYQRNSMPLRVKLLSNFDLWCRRIRKLGPLGRLGSKNRWSSGVTKRLLGVHPDRELPVVQKTSLRQWWSDRTLTNKLPAIKKRKVQIFCDEFTNHLDVEVGKAAIELLERIGYDVVLLENVESGRSAISFGNLKVARGFAEENVRRLASLGTDDEPIVGIEPSAILSLRDEYPCLLYTSPSPRDATLSRMPSSA